LQLRRRKDPGSKREREREAGAGARKTKKAVVAAAGRQEGAGAAENGISLGPGGGSRTTDINRDTCTNLGLCSSLTGCIFPGNKLLLLLYLSGPFFLSFFLFCLLVADAEQGRIKVGPARSRPWLFFSLFFSPFLLLLLFLFFSLELNFSFHS
jgi:hypothetical protein